MRFPDFVPNLQQQHESALKSQNLIFIPTEVHHIDSQAGLKCEIRLAPSLGQKPISSSSSKPPPDFDPFAPPYVPELFIGKSEDDVEGEEGYVLLLNKFCVVPRHFLLITQAFRSQSTPPTPEDLLAIHNLLLHAQKADPTSEWISFYNCGQHSGASQPHKHFQFIPTDIGGNPFGALLSRSAPPKIGDVYNVPELGYAHFACAIPADLGLDTHQDETEAILAKLFMALLDSMIDHLRHLTSQDSSSTHTTNQALELSYNFLMTRNYMLLVPRSSESFLPVGVSVNSLGVGAGMILVKNQNELDVALQVGIDTILKAVTFPVLKDFIDPCEND